LIFLLFSRLCNPALFSSSFLHSSLSQSLFLFACLLLCGRRKCLPER
jgi:hypothetical protein